ncbi:MAG: 8-amino-7-oxononanoate synthase [Betaproteobacteria bacterium RIFCSPLOWO2_02_64_14]|nr:MAG: 8-amino-7-oxononanoate synthase [Betaproteobacteria bacterium RIFCSPLOWO2_02_64_14]
MDNSTLNVQRPTPFASLAAELAGLETRGLRRSRRVLQGPQGARVMVDGRESVAFCSNDYLGLAAHPEIISAARAAAADYGIGAGASHLILGHSEPHHVLEHALARHVALPRALLFSTGYMANIGAVTALVGRGDAVFGDRLNHASLNDAAILSRAEFRRYPHRDMVALDRMLARSRATRKLIVTDAVFSMDGDIAPVPELVALAERHDAWLLLDDAHGFGVLGHDGRGTLSHFGVSSPRIVYMGTLGKAAGVFGAFVAGEREVVETCVQRARTYVYTTAMPPLLARAVLRSLELMVVEDWRRKHLLRLVAILRAGLARTGWRLLESQTAIQPLVVGDNAGAVSLSRKLAERGLLVPAIRPPTVPVGTARLRVSLSAAHSEDEVRRLTGALTELQ